MIGDEAEVRLGMFRRVRLVPRHSVRRLIAQGSVEVHRRGKVSQVPSRLVHEITPRLADELARELLSTGVPGFGAVFLGELTTRHGFEGRERGLKNLLMSGYVMIDIEEPRYRWGGRPAPARRDEAEPDVQTEPRSWVALTVVDDDEPGRPLPRLHFRMRLPDGATRTGALDGQGHALVEDVEPGRCWVELMDVRRGLTP
jgi:hypothetical protein